MAPKAKKSLRGSIDDLLDDLLGYDDETPVKSSRASQPVGSSNGRARGSSSQASKKSFLEDDFFSKVPAEDMEAAEEFSVSDADPQALLHTMKDMDDLEAELLGLPKPSSGPGETTVKSPGKCDSLGEAVKTTGKLLAPEKRESVPGMEKKPLSSATAPQKYKKFNFEDLDDPLAGLLSDEEKSAPEKPAQGGSKNSSEKKAEQSKEKEPTPTQVPLHTTAPVRRREKLTFEDDGDDLMDALGFGSDPKGDEKQGKKTEEEELQPACAKLDELLGQGSVAKILEPSGMGECKEFQVDQKYQKQPEKEEGWNEEDFVFGTYQPTVASKPEGRSSRRQSVSRFSAESSNEPKPDPRSKPPPQRRQSSVRGSGSGGDWLGLKDEEFLGLESPSPAKANPAVSYPTPATARRPGSTTQLLDAEDTAAKPDLLEEEDWLSAALARKKAQAQAKAQERNAKASEALGEGLDPHSPIRQPVASRGALQQASALQDKAVSTGSSGQSVPWLSTIAGASAHPSEVAKGEPSRDASTLVPTALVPGEQETRDPAPLVQVTAPRAQLQAAPQLQVESPALGLLQKRRPASPPAQLQEDVSGCQVALISAQTRVAELESQVRTLELERTQHKLLLESLQQRHQEDLDLLENAHRSQMKVMEETYRQREERLQQEKEQLAAQLVSQSQDMEQARAELVAQHQQRVATLEQQSTLEMERLRELQRVSVQEMCKDYEEQLQRLKRLKDQEIDAVTSATSQTRSLNSIVEQIEKFSSDLHNLLHKVETTHHTTSQELATEARQRDRQLKVLQERLAQQQRDMEEERSRFQEVIAKMDARLGEQTRLLEQERWRATTEQSKVESQQHSLEEQRRVMTQQLSMERAELERAKSALLEEQKSVMQKCSEERRKLAAEWGEFHTQQKLSKERLEHDMDRARQMDSQREGTIMSLAKEQAELTFRGRELKAKEEKLVRDRELLEEAWQELRQEKEKVNMAMLHVQRQEEEAKRVAKLSSQKYEEGERALREARRVESQHQSRLQVMQQHLEQLKQQEQHLHQMRQEWLIRVSQGTQLHRELPSNPMTLLTTDQDLSAHSRILFPPPAATSPTQAFVPGFPPLNRDLPQHSLGDGGESLAMASPAVFYTQLLLLQHQAQQDRDFLEDEEFFLETLTKASSNTSSLSY
ncbi:fas-binding factor 1 isoform X2 [Calypte anna]|uniref:fas-binding factor 1 isoform X2 n=1 Tax=Calypte anna TaxID=9244 RepID=UPI0011C3E7C9|nr:fas-binding factor 1 isoform X2 [Calypte anna]